MKEWFEYVLYSELVLELVFNLVYIGFMCDEVDGICE